MIRWGILGCGSIARHAVAPAISWSRNGELLAIASRSADAAEEKCAALGAKRAYGSYEGLLADPDIDAVYIGLPNGLHAPWALRAAEAGKHVLCEKSLTLEARVASHVAGLFRTRRLRLVEAFMYRHHPQWEAVRGLIAGGAIGELRAIRAGLSGMLVDPDDHRWSRELGGGALFDVTCYAVNVARLLAGSEPTRVRASAEMRGNVDVATSASLVFPGGILASVVGSLGSAPEQFVVVTGTRGVLHVDKPFIPGWEPTTVRVTSDAGELRIEVAGANHYLHMVEHFAALVADPERSAFPAEDGEANVAVCHAIAGAMRT